MAVQTEAVPKGRKGSQSGLEGHGIRNVTAAYWNLSAAALLEHAIERREGHLAENGGGSHRPVYRAIPEG